MKKFSICFLLMVVLIVSSYNMTAFAASNTYKLDELGLKVTIPSGYSVITRDTPASDSAFDQIGMTKADVISHFKTNNIYLNAILNDSNREEVVVTMVESDLSNFSLLSDTALAVLASALEKEYSTYGYNVSKHDIYHHSQANFIMIYFTDVLNTVRGLQYYTIYDGKAINFTMRSYDGDITSKQEKTIKTIVKSVKFNKEPLKAESGEDTKSFKYTDADSGVTFTVPANWEQKAFSKDREYIDVKFVSTKEAGCTIIYGSSDIWAELSSYEKAGHSRADINMSTFTKEDVAEMYGGDTDANDIYYVTYNGVQYYQGKIAQSTEVYGFDVSVNSTQVIYISNGWMYSFQFYGSSNSMCLDDFKALLNSVKYPEIVNDTSNDVSINLYYANDYNVSESISSSYSYEPDNNNSNSNLVSWIIFIDIVLVLAVAVVTVIFVYKRRNQKGNTESSFTSNEIETATTNTIQRGTICKNCGQTLPYDSAFCHMCGNKIDKRNENESINLDC